MVACMRNGRAQIRLSLAACGLLCVKKECPPAPVVMFWV